MNRTLPTLLIAVCLIPTASALTATDVNQTQVLTHDLRAGGQAQVNESLRVNGSLFQFGHWNTNLLGNITNTTLTDYRTWTYPDHSGTHVFGDATETISGSWTFTNTPTFAAGNVALRDADNTFTTLGTQAIAGAVAAPRGYFPLLDSNTTATLFNVIGTGLAANPYSGSLVAPRGYFNTSLTSGPLTSTTGTFSGLLTANAGATIASTYALTLTPTSSATLPAAVEGALVYDTTNDVFKGGISGSPSYRTLATLETANTWTATQAFGTTTTTTSTIGTLNVQSTTGTTEATFTSATANAEPNSVVVRKARGTIASPTEVQSSDGILDFITQARSGSTWFTTGSFGFQIDGAFTSGQRPPTRIVFQTNPANTAPAEVLRIDRNGDFTIADTGDFIFSTGTGTKFGTATTQKMGWWNAAPVARSTWTLTSNDLTDNSGGTASDTTINNIAVNCSVACADGVTTRAAVATLAAKADELTVDVAAIKTILSTYGLVG